MRTRLISLIAFAVFCSIYLISACNRATEPKSVKLSTKQDTIERGKYLVSTIGCGDCHSPKMMTPQGPVPDTSRALSGHPSDMPIGRVNKAELKSWLLFTPDLTAFIGPWGVSYAANITSDETGIGGWTEQQFFTAIRKGKSKGIETNRDILPPMPWQNFAQLNDDDLKAMFLYLKSTKPVKNVVPAAIPPDKL